MEPFSLRHLHSLSLALTDTVTSHRSPGNRSYLKIENDGYKVTSTERSSLLEIAHKAEELVWATFTEEMTPNEFRQRNESAINAAKNIQQLHGEQLAKYNQFPKRVGRFFAYIFTFVIIPLFGLGYFLMRRYLLDEKQRLDQQSIEIQHSVAFLKQFEDPECVSHQTFSTEERSRIFKFGDNGRILSMSTFGDIRASNREKVHELTPKKGLSYDAGYCHILRDQQGQAEGGIVTSADGFGRDRDNVMQPTALAARVAAMNLAGKLMNLGTDQEILAEDSKELVEKLRQLIPEIDGEIYQTTRRVGIIGGEEGQTNVGGIRILRTSDSQCRIIGVNLGNQRIMITHAKTGNTTSLYASLKKDGQPGDDSFGKSALGGVQKAYNENEVAVIDRTIEILLEDAIIWIATDGAWQNLPKEEGCYYKIDTVKLSEVLQQDSKEGISPDGLASKLEEMVQTNARSTRERLFDIFANPKSIGSRNVESEIADKALDDATITILGFAQPPEFEFQG